MTDRDLELLDGYLDGALSDTELQEVESRLENDVVFIGELARLRGDREMRTMVWNSLQGDEASAETVMAKVDAALEQRDVWTWRMRALRTVGAMAACIIVGFAVGWLGKHGRVPVSDVMVATQDQRVVQQNNNMYLVSLKDDAGRVVAQQRFDSLEKARAFADDMNKWQERQTQMQNGNVLLVGDKF